MTDDTKPGFKPGHVPLSEEMMLTAEYQSHAHAIQSGVMAEMGLNGDHAATTPKHLRVGVNMAMSDMSGIAKLLMDKGVFTRLEYLRAITEAARQEKERYEFNLSTHYGKKVTLG